MNWGGEKGKPLPDDVKKKLLDEYNASKQAYDKKINGAYYTSKKFAKDATLAVGKSAAQMGVRQALGFVFLEIWLAVKEEMREIPSGFQLEETAHSLVNGVKKGLDNAKKKYKEMLTKLEEGIAAGALASLTTTICNIFTTTMKNVVKCMRQIYASLVQAGKVLLFNPDNLMFGDRIKTAMIIIATGASVLLGTIVGDMICKTPIGMSPVGGIVSTFCSTMISGILSCTQNSQVPVHRAGVRTWLRILISHFPYRRSYLSNSKASSALSSEAPCFCARKREPLHRICHNQRLCSRFPGMAFLQGTDEEIFFQSGIPHSAQAVRQRPAAFLFVFHPG